MWGNMKASNYFLFPTWLNDKQIKITNLCYRAHNFKKHNMIKKNNIKGKSNTGEKLCMLLKINIYVHFHDLGSVNSFSDMTQKHRQKNVDKFSIIKSLNFCAWNNSITGEKNLKELGGKLF